MISCRLQLPPARVRGLSPQSGHVPWPGVEPAAFQCIGQSSNQPSNTSQFIYCTCFSSWQRNQHLNFPILLFLNLFFLFIITFILLCLHLIFSVRCLFLFILCFIILRLSIFLSVKLLLLFKIFCGEVWFDGHLTIYTISTVALFGMTVLYALFFRVQACFGFVCHIIFFMFRRRASFSWPTGKILQEWNLIFAGSSSLKGSVTNTSWPSSMEEAKVGSKVHQVFCTVGHQSWHMSIKYPGSMTFSPHTQKQNTE